MNAAGVIVLAVVLTAIFLAIFGDKLYKCFVKNEEQNGDPNEFKVDDQNPVDWEEIKVHVISAPSKLKVMVEHHPNDHYITIHTNVRFSDGKYISSEFEWEEVPEFGKQILAIHGVEKITIKSYEISVLKGNVFEWDEIVPSVKEILEKEFGQGGIIELDEIPAPPPMKDDDWIYNSR